MKNTVKAISLLAALAAAACSGSDAQETPAQAKAPQALQLSANDVAVVTMQESAAGIRITGSLDPADVVDVKAQVGGQLTRVNVERGDAVRAGQLLATIDAATQQAQSAGARAQLAAAERDFGAAEMLFKAGAVAERDYVNARAARDAARAQVTQIGQSIAHTTIEAPQGGVVTAKHVSDGEVITPGTELFSIADTRRLELKGNIPASDIGQVRVGQKVTLTLEAYPGRVLHGRVDRFDPVADAETRQVTVYVTVDNGNRELVGGLFATGLIETGQTITSPRVPESAVVEGSVYEVSGGSVRKVAIGDVRAGEKVIVTPAPELKEGQRVEVSR
ncbi:MAG TPA: efflux RND transporter periplasmic adaptor subunit [Thermoanaerobaculia bacterium]|nr:efflux RND transporter periplasmic adaptor subunit [Thermoanaerobaculia bacterium]